MDEYTVVVALGGNAFIRKGEPDDIDTQWRNISSAIKGIVDLIEDGYKVVITHGNGPQVGKILEWVSYGNEYILPMDIAVAMTQGWLGYMIQITMYNELWKRGLDKKVVCIVNNLAVDRDDPAFTKPSKPIGSYYNKEDAERLAKKLGWIMEKDVRGGYRRVVPSPEPIDNLELEPIKDLVSRGYIVVACGGGGIPVVREDGYRGVEAVIDKDLASSLLASKLGAEYLLILTDVDGVYINFNKPGMRKLGRISVEEIKRLYSEGQFPPGSMGPKILACIKFLENGGRQAMIGHLTDAYNIVKGRAGTVIYRD